MTKMVANNSIRSVLSKSGDRKRKGEKDRSKLREDQKLDREREREEENTTIHVKQNKHYTQSHTAYTLIHNYYHVT